ncbi:MAG TPA: hypothetical protein VM165_07100 [Planctomycetaceae bacterium]|nr:hypothetical protein [Planctomycetaceae bacterium]
MDKAYEWCFRKKSRGEMNADPTAEEFFNTEAIRDLGEAFVREAVQNSLDAGRGPVRVQIRLSNENQTVQREDSRQFFYGLKPHLDAVPDILRATSAEFDRFGYLIYEDFGTRGLRGDPAQSEDSDTASDRNDFFYFWRNVGRGQKSGSDRGRWGLGKTVFPAASRINSFFGLTVRSDDNQRLMMGHAVLKIHKADGVSYTPYGYFGRVESDEFVLPITDKECLDAFSETFHLSRTSEPGFSVVMPLPDDDITGQSLKRAIIEHFFVSILAGELMVEITDGQDTVALNESTIHDLSRSMPGHDTAFMGKLVELADWARQRDDSERISLHAPSPDRAADWAPHLFPNGVLSRIGEQLESGQRIMLRVPVHVKPNSGEREETFFDVALEQDDLASASEQVYVRKGLTISGVKSSGPRGIRAVVLVEHSPLARFLGDAENPAHTEWQERSPKFKDKYTHGASLLRFVRNSVKKIIEHVNAQSAEIDEKALRHVFWVDPPQPEPPQVRGKHPKVKPSDESETPDEDVTLDPAPPRPFAVRQMEGGFEIKGNPASVKLPAYIEVRAAFDVRKGNPFKKYRTFDFELDDSRMSIETVHAVVEELGENRLLIRPQAVGFEVTVLGFETQRDLIVDVRAVERDDA